jgi:hypothetical protein
MNRTLAGFLGFIGGLIAGYCIILFGWVAYTTIADVSDMGGGKAMGIAFFFAPLGGVIAGAVCSFLLVRLAGKPKPAAGQPSPS